MATHASPLLDFVTQLNDEPGFRAQFEADPTGTMTAAGLSPEDQEVVQSRDLERINAAITEHGGTVPPNQYFLHEDAAT